MIQTHSDMGHMIQTGVIMVFIKTCLKGVLNIKARFVVLFDSKQRETELIFHRF